jgi:hypothetical protein
MLHGGQRSCDVCEAVIPKGEKYVACTVPKGEAPLFQGMMQVNPELATTTTPDSQGNLRLDVCLHCHMNMSISGTPTVN